jgi:protein O-mannosyl-transferase
VTKRKRRRASSGVQPPPAPRPSSEASGRIGGVWPVLALVAIAVIAYANAFRNGFALDDISMIVENPLVRDVGNVREIFTTNYWHRGGVALVYDPTLYRPLTVFSYAVDFALWGLSPAAYHAVNVALHAAATVVLFLIAAQVFGSLAAAFAAAAIFAVHPIHTEAVTGVVGRAEVLATLFFLMAFWILRQRSAFRVGAMGDASLARTIGRVALGALLYLLGLSSKETAVTLPAVLALDDWLHRAELPRDRRSAITVLAMRYGALALVAVIYFVLRQQAVSGTAQIWPGFVGVSAFQRMLTASRVMLEYVGLFVFPRALLADYWKTDVPIATSLVEPLVLASMLLWIGVAALVFRKLRRDTALVFSIAWFFITIAPVSNVLFPIGVAKAERLLYLPSVGLCLLAGWAYGRAESAIRASWAPRLALAAVLAVFTVRTVVRNKDWKDNLTLALATLEVSPSSPLMNDAAAGELVRRGESKRAVELLQVAVREAPDMPLIRGHLGAAYQSQGQIDQAIGEYQEAIRRNPADAESHNNLGVAYLDKRRVEEAVAEFTAAIKINPRYADPHMNLGVIHLDRGQLTDAVAEFSAAVQLNPASAQAHNSLGVGYFRLGQLDRAEEQYREALRLDPDYAAARENLTRLEAARGGTRR